MGGGKHLKPHQVEELVKHRGDDVVFFDGRNAYEARVGKFKNADRDYLGRLMAGLSA